MRLRTSLLFITVIVLLLCSSSSFARKAVTCHRSKCMRSRHHLNAPKHHHARRALHKPACKAQPLMLNVESFGAVADRITNNFKPFKAAWDMACKSRRSARILVPEGKTYYIKHIDFTGPCRSSISMEIQGTIKSFPQMYDVPKRRWIMFEDVRNINLSGSGTLDGNGAVWWKNSCKLKKTEPCQSQSAPTALTLKNCTNLRIRGLRLVNAQQMHVNFQDCDVVDASRLWVAAPERSPNTDGIHVTRTTNIKIQNSVIKTGDDCVSIVNGSRNVEVRNIICGPGHGISIGSLGEDHTENLVSDITVKRVKMTGTTNGVRIKTWQGGRGTAKNIVFEDIAMKNVSNPIIIDQYYCDKSKKCVQEKSGVQVENIVYRNIWGTSASKVAINFNCSKTVPCRNIVLDNVKLGAQSKGQEVEAVCSQILALQSVRLSSNPSCPLNN